MKKQLMVLVGLMVYAAMLVKIMVLKELPVIRIGSLMFSFGGTQTGPSNLTPFKTISLYFNEGNATLIGFINLAGNIALLIPVGFLTPIVFQNINWITSFFIGMVAGLLIESAQMILRVGIFDIDDILLNAIGVFTGYLIFAVLVKRVDSKDPGHKISGATIL